MFPRVFFAKASIANQMRHSQTLCVSLIAPLCWVGCLGSRDVMVNLVHWPPSSAIRPHSELLICVGGILWDIGVKGVDSPGTYQVIVVAGLCMLFFWWTLSGQRSYLLLGSQLSFPVFMELQLRNSPGKWRVDNICLLELSLLWIIGLLIIPYHSQRNMCKRNTLATGISGSVPWIRSVIGIWSMLPAYMLSEEASIVYFHSWIGMILKDEIGIGRNDK